MKVLEEHYSDAGLELPSLENAWKTFMEPLDYTPENISTTSRGTNSESEYIWGDWSGTVAETCTNRSSQPKSKVPVSKGKQPMAEGDAGSHFACYSIILATTVRLFPFLNLDIAFADVDFDRVDDIFANEPISYPILNLFVALTRLPTTSSPPGHCFPALGNYDMPTLSRRHSMIRLDKPGLGSNVDRSVSLPMIELEVQSQLLKLLQLLRDHICKEKNLMTGFENNTDCESPRASSEGANAQDSCPWGRKQLNNWKIGAGRAKGWKRGPSTKALTKRKRTKYDRKNVVMRTLRYRCDLDDDEPGQSEVPPVDMPVAALKSCEARLTKASNRKWRYTKIPGIKHGRMRGKALSKSIFEEIEAKPLAEDNMDNR